MAVHPGSYPKNKFFGITLGLQRWLKKINIISEDLKPV